MRVERHWWNGDHSVRGRRDVYIRTDGEFWEVEAQAGGSSGRSKVHRCPGRQSAEILAGAWMGGRTRWLLVGSGRAASLPSGRRRLAPGTVTSETGVTLPSSGRGRDTAR